MPEIENKQAVFVISPQWFTETDYEPAAFQRFFNSDQLTAFLENQSGDTAAKHAAIRLLKQNPNVALKGIVQKLSKGEELSEVDQVAINILPDSMRDRLLYLVSSPLEENSNIRNMWKII